jgi:hypothetical protein
MTLDPDRLQILDLAYHRNGVAGLPFKVALVDDATCGDVKLVIMFEQEGYTAVLSVDKLHEDEDITFASNSWRGDQYEAALRPEMWNDGTIPADDDDLDDLI